MKNILIFLAGAMVTVLVLGIAGYAFAQTQTPPTPSTSQENFNWGMMGGRFQRGFGMMGRFSGQGGPDGYGPMHEYMVDAFAEALDVSPEALQEKLNAGQTMWQIAEEEGIKTEEFTNLMLEARTKALDQAVADGLITQEQADWMVQRMTQMHANGFGSSAGGCGGFRSGGWRGGPAGSWSATPTPNP